MNFTSDQIALLLFCCCLAFIFGFMFGEMSVITDRASERDFDPEPAPLMKLAEPAEILARAQRMERGEPIYSDGPLPETGWDGDAALIVQPAKGAV